MLKQHVLNTLRAAPHQGDFTRPLGATEKSWHDFDRLQNWPPPADEYFSSIGAGGCGWGQRALERASAIILAPKRGKYLGWRDNGKGAPPAAISVAEP